MRCKEYVQGLLYDLEIIIKKSKNSCYISDLLSFLNLKDLLANSLISSVYVRWITWDLESFSRSNCVTQKL
jgi:hypothetical protein